VSVTAATLLRALRQKHSADAVVREVVIDDPVELAIRRRASIESTRRWSGDDHAERRLARFAAEGRPVADEVPDGWDHRSSIPRRRIDALIFASTGITAVEIKVTRADFRRDTDAKRRAWRSVTNRFVYLVPKGLVTPDEVADGCGLWEFDLDRFSTQYSSSHGITATKRAKVTKDPEPLPFQVTQALAYRVSGHERKAVADA
jgi:hypothetical protein